MPVTRRPKKNRRPGDLTWLNPREPLPESAKPRPLLDAALDALGVDNQIAETEIMPEIVAAVIKAQALDRLGKRIIEAAAVGRVVVRQ